MTSYSCHSCRVGVSQQINFCPNCGANLKSAGERLIPEVPRDAERQILASLGARRKIAAIKEFRRATGASLTEAKARIDQLSTQSLPDETTDNIPGESDSNKPQALGGKRFAGAGLCILILFGVSIYWVNSNRMDSIRRNPPGSDTAHSDTPKNEALGRIDKLRRDAESGDRDAQFELGAAYEFGKDVEKDLSTAADWYQKASDQGSSKAEAALAGLIYLSHISPQSLTAAQYQPKVRPEEENWDGVYLKDFAAFQEGTHGFIAYFVLGKGNGEMVARKGRAKLTIYGEIVSEPPLKIVEKKFTKASFQPRIKLIGGTVLACCFDRIDWFDFPKHPANGRDCQIRLDLYAGFETNAPLWETSFKTFRVEYY